MIFFIDRNSLELYFFNLINIIVYLDDVNFEF